MDLLSDIWNLWLLVDEPIGTVLGLVVVWFLVRENVWAWPLGVAYVIVSITVLWEARLYANLLLHVVAFLPLNLYGWYYWLFGTEQREELGVTRASWSGLAILAVLGVATVAALPVLGQVVAAALEAWFGIQTDAPYPYWDSSVFAMSLAAMWLTARKKIENWMIWFVVNIISVFLYSWQELYGYASLYAIYLGMAVWGYMAWRRSMLRTGTG